MSAGPDLAAVLDSLDGVEGWLSDAQAQRLWDGARALEGRGRIVEIGSYRGRSAIVLATAAGPSGQVIAIDPHAGNDRGPQQITGTRDEGDADHRAFWSNLQRAGIDRRIRHVRKPSNDALTDVEGDIDLLYVDGAHRYGPARADLVLWGERVRVGSTMLVHDSFSSIGVTLATLRALLTGTRFRYVGRTGSLAEYRREDLGPRDRLLNGLRLAGELPWFARNVIVKAAIVTRQRWLARLMGHRSGDWPY